MQRRCTIGLIKFGLLPVIFGLAVGVRALGEAAGEAAGEADEILNRSGVEGGLVVHVGCGGGELAAELCRKDAFLVHGLDRSPENVKQARSYLAARGIYGKASVEHLTGGDLPYIDNLVNLIVVDTRCEMRDAGSEILRVLTPRGVAIVREKGNEAWLSRIPHPVSRIGDGFVMFAKPPRAEMDEWTHYLYDARGNPVSQDTLIRPPLGHLQWVGGPRWSRHHDHMSSVSACVSSEGRVFYILDEGHRASIITPPAWKLVARDAFNGLVLWKRDIPQWYSLKRRLKSGPAHLPRRLVAVGDRVYLTLGMTEPVSCLDAATGETQRVYEGTAGTEEIICSNGTVFLVVNETLEQENHRSPVGYEFDRGKRRISAVDADRGNVVWSREFPWVAPLTLTADSSNVYFCDGKTIRALSRDDGHERWQSAEVAIHDKMETFFAPNLLVYKDTVLFSGGEHYGPMPWGPDRKQRHVGLGVNDTITALSAADGKPLWTCPDPPSGYRSPEDLFVIDDTLWHAPLAYGLDPAVFRGRDMKTGEVRAEFAPDIDLNRSFGHHRCHRGRATSRYVLTSCLGVEFVDLAKQQWHINHWVRGACLYGIMPANGMIYAPQHPCACYQMAKLYGFCALAPETDDKAENRKLRSADQLERGPAYEQIENRESEIENPHDWPTYRHDIRRSGSTPMPVSTTLTKKWRTAIGGKLSSVTAAGSRVFLASVDRHMLFALDSEDGSVCWSFTANGRIDSPPSICAGKVVLGSCDGSVYCLRATDGALVWRYRPQTANRKMMFFDQLEATHPVHGSVSVKDGKAYFIAGRTAVLDGGLHFVCLDVHTGREQFNHNLSFPPGGKKWDSFIDWVDMGTLLSDILVGDDTRIYLRTQPLDYSGAVPELLTPAQTRDANTARHLIPATGFLDDDYWHRSYWLYGNWRTQSYIYYQDGLRNPAGRILVVDDSRIFGFGRKRKYYRWTTPIEHELFAMDKNPSPVKAKGGKGGTHLPRRWQQEIPFFAYAMVKADTTVFAAGPPDIVDEERVWRNLGAKEVQACLKKQDEAFRGTAGGRLWAVDAKDGTKIKELILDSPPVWDGMAAACNKLYVTLRDGSVVCFE